MATKFDRNKYPSIPRGARFKGNTVFHRRARFWEIAEKAIQKFEAKSKTKFSRKNRPEKVDEIIGKHWDGAVVAIQKFEAHCDAMEAWYCMLNRANDVAKKAIEDAGLTLQEKEGRVLHDKVELQYVKEHPVKFPE